MYSSNCQHTNTNCITSIKNWCNKTFNCLKHTNWNPILSQDLNNYLFADYNQSTVNNDNKKNRHVYQTNEDLGIYQPSYPEVIIIDSFESVDNDSDSSDDLDLSNSSIRQLTTGDSLEINDNVL